MMNKRQKAAIIAIIIYIAFSPTLYIIGKLFKITFPFDVFMIPIYLGVGAWIMGLFLVAILGLLEALS